MARALLVGCGCRGRELGGRLLEQGWQVRGTTRDPERIDAMEGAGFEGVAADPDRLGTVLDHVGDVTVIAWLLGSAEGAPEVIKAIHGARLERLMEELVDTPVRGFVYEGAGRVQTHHLERGAGVVRAANETWRIPVEVVALDPTDHETWTAAMAAAFEKLVS